MCKEKTVKTGELCKKPYYEDGYCKTHYEKRFGIKPKLKYKAEAEAEAIVEDKSCENIKTKKCSCKDHIKSGSIYPRDKVPLEKFLKHDLKRNINENSRKEEYYQYCEECRAFSRKYRKTRRENIKKENKADSDEFGVCMYLNHETYSEYPRTRVPKDIFKQIRKTNNAKTTKSCLDCRKALNKRARENDEIAQKKSSFRCRVCRCRDPDLRAKNLDGSFSKALAKLFV